MSDATCIILTVIFCCLAAGGIAGDIVVVYSYRRSHRIGHILPAGIAFALFTFGLIVHLLRWIGDPLTTPMPNNFEFWIFVLGVFLKLYSLHRIYAAREREPEKEAIPLPDERGQG